MMITKTKLISSLALALLASPITSSAAPISGTYNFSSTEFTSTFGSVAPVGTVTGSFSVSFDNSTSIPDTTVGLTLNSINLPFAVGLVAFRYGKALDRLTLGQEVNGDGVEFLASLTNDFRLTVNTFSTVPTFVQFGYTVATQNDVWISRTVSISKVAEVTSVPEPGTLALLGVGLAGLGVARRNRAA